MVSDKGGLSSFGSEDMEYEDDEEDDETEEHFQSEDVEDVFSSSKLPPVQLPLDYNLHLKRRTVLPTAKSVKLVKQEPLDEAMEIEQERKQVKLVKPVFSTPTSVQTSPRRVTAAELFTPSGVSGLTTCAHAVFKFGRLILWMWSYNNIHIS